MRLVLKTIAMGAIGLALGIFVGLAPDLIAHDSASNNPDPNASHDIQLNGITAMRFPAGLPGVVDIRAQTVDPSTNPAADFIRYWFLTSGGTTTLKAKNPAGTAVPIGGVGGDTGVVSVSAKLALATAQSIPSGSSNTPVNWNGNDIDDTHNLHSTTTTPSRIVFNTAGAGKYTIACRLSFASNSTTAFYRGMIRKNGTTTIATGATGRGHQSLSSTIATVAVDDPTIQATDYIEILPHHNVGIPVNLNTGADTTCGVGRYN